MADPNTRPCFLLAAVAEIANLAAVAYANQLCNMYGMDTISCGATIAWAMDCFERGLIGPEDTGGLDLHFGGRGSHGTTGRSHCPSDRLWRIAG